GARLVQLQQDETRSKNVTGDSEARTNSRRRLKCLTRVWKRLYEFERSISIFFGVERKRGFVLRQVMAIAIVSIFFLQTASVRQQDLQQVGSATRAVNWSTKALSDQARQVAGVIDVRVRDQHGVERVRIERRILPVALAQFLQALKHST